MPYIIFDIQRHVPVAYIEAPYAAAEATPGFLPIPCEVNADIDDAARWLSAYEEYLETGVFPAVDDIPGAKQEKLSEVMRGYSAAFAPIEAIYPTEERETWPIQLEEARAVLADPTTETPMLSILVALRGLGETVTDFAQIVMINNAMYRQFAAYITGQQQRMYREVNALDTAEAIQAYEVQYDMPPGVAEYLGL